jgi:hypothetical protein
LTVGRDDYLIVRDNGDVYAYRNAGNAEKPAFWEDLGMIFKGNGMPDIEGVRFVDVSNVEWESDHLYQPAWRVSRTCPRLV